VVGVRVARSTQAFRRLGRDRHRIGVLASLERVQAPAAFGPRMRPSLSVDVLPVLDGSAQSVDPLARNEEDCVGEVATQRIDAPDGSRDRSRRRGRIAGEDTRVRLGSQLLVRAPEIGILAQNDAVGVPGVFEQRPIFGSRREIVPDDRDIVALATECRDERWRACSSASSLTLRVPVRSCSPGRRDRGRR
jgi:hypothetical protein